ncbi:MAG: acetyltransferase [Cytophagales bacterium]|nr:MAG: acetyltransferase [Cytophagales bacterium]
MEKNPVIIFGANGIGKIALEIFKNNGMEVYCFLDDNKKLHQTSIGDVSILGSTDDDGFLKYIGKKCDAFVATDDNKLRENIINTVIEKRKVMPVNAIHSNAYISPDASIGYGNLIHTGAIINTGCEIKNNCIVNAGVILDYDVKIEDQVQIGSGSTIGAGVEIANSAFIGTGVTIVAGVKIGKKARIGAGSVVIGDIKSGETVFGNPAQVVK